MKRHELEKALREAGWRLLRHGRRHDLWTNGELTEGIPRHREVHERLAERVLRRARQNPPQGE